MAAKYMPRARVAYKLSHQWMRKRLNAGCTIPSVPPVNSGREWLAAREVVLSTGRQPAPVYDHALHYHATYERRAKAGGTA